MKLYRLNRNKKARLLFSTKQEYNFFKIYGKKPSKKELKQFLDNYSIYYKKIIYEK